VTALARWLMTLAEKLKALTMAKAELPTSKM
jgi:hypothetical protein